MSLSFPALSQSLTLSRHTAWNTVRLATATALPVASLSGNGGTVSGRVPEAVGKVMPVSGASKMDLEQEKHSALGGVLF